MIAFEVFGSVLPFSILGLVQILHDFGACRLRPFEVCSDIINEYRKALCLVSAAPRLGRHRFQLGVQQL